MRRIGIKTLGGCLAVAGLILAVPCAQATTYYNFTTIDANPGLAGSGVAGGGDSVATQIINGGIFTSQVDGTVVGTGVLQPFVRIQQTGNGNCQDPCIESGYNTNSTNEQFQTKDNGGTNWNHAIKVSDVQLETIDGVKYRTFVLDINEAKNDDRFLSLDKFKIYLGSAGDFDKYTESTPDCNNNGTGTPTPTCVVTESLKNTAGTISATKIFDIDTGTPGGAGDSTLGLNYALNSGSGKGVDLYARIPDAVFQAHLSGNPNDQYVYLYSSFGATGDLASNGNSKALLPPGTSPAGLLPVGNYAQSAGFEEWSTRVGKTPEPLTAGLLLIGLAALGISRRQRHVVAC